jgi:hypothetical protein
MSSKLFANQPMRRVIETVTGIEKRMPDYRWISRNSASSKFVEKHLLRPSLF